MHINYDVNRNPSSLGFDNLNLSFDNNQPVNFPVCEANVFYDGRGYNSIFGWIQIVNLNNKDDNEKDSIVDTGPLFKGIDTPFFSFGKLPTLFDAPCSINVKNLDWTAQSFLVVVGDIVGTKDIYYVAGFEWGFKILDEHIQIKPIKELFKEDWNRQIHFLNTECPSWKFTDG